eukprot:gene494-763_t
MAYKQLCRGDAVLAKHKDLDGRFVPACVLDKASDDCHVEVGPVHNSQIMPLDAKCPESAKQQKELGLVCREGAGGQLVWPAPVLALNVMRDRKNYKGVVHGKTPDGSITYTALSHVIYYRAADGILDVKLVEGSTRLLGATLNDEQRQAAPHVAPEVWQGAAITEHAAAWALADRPDLYSLMKADGGCLQLAFQAVKQEADK